MGLEWPKNEENRRPTVAAAAAFAGLIRAHPAAVGLEISGPRSPSGGAPPWLTHVASSKEVVGIVSHGSNPIGLKKVSKRPSSGSIGLGGVFSGFLGYVPSLALKLGLYRA